MKEAANHVVLYRKYRPTSFSDIVGQEHVVRVLKNALRLDRVAHAYLFAGIRGTGKTTLARLLAKAYNCENLSKEGEPCNTCETCLEFSSGRALDLIEIDAASNRGIDDIRELRESVRFSPMRARHKVYIIDEVHMLTKEAFNALLKTLEEPPAHAMFILATTELDRVPETILSRVQSFEFRRLPQEKIRERLKTLLKKESYKLDEDGMTLISFLADGSLRDAETMLGQLMDAYPEGAGKEALETIFGVPKLSLVHELIQGALEKKPKRIVEAMQSLSSRGIDAKLLSKFLIHEAKLLLLMLLSEEEKNRLKNELSQDHFHFFESLASVDRSLVEKLLLKVLDSYNAWYRGPYPELPLELALLSVAGDHTQHNGLQKPSFLRQ